MERILRRSLRGTALLGVPLVLIVMLGNAFASPGDLRVIVNFLITLVLVLAIQSFSGNSGIVSFGHVGFMGVGAYVAAILTIPVTIKTGLMPALPGFLANNTISFVPAVLVAGAVGAIIASAIGLALTRMREGAMAMATIGVLVILFVVLDNWEGVTRGSLGIYGVPQSTTVWAALVFAILTILVCRIFRESNSGLELRASRTDALAAESLGANVVRLRWWAWTLSGAIMGVGGALWAQYNIAFGPRQFFFATTFNLLAMLVVGGLGSVSGAIMGAFLVTTVFEIMRRIEENIQVPGITQIVVVLLILLVLYRRPNGLMGLSEADDLLARRVAGLRNRRAADAAQNPRTGC